MATPLLTTKLYIPPPRPSLASRPRLLERLNAGLHRKLTLVSAPAGFGKTTLLSEWASQRVSESASGRPVAWVSLDEGDNDPARFLAYCIAALQTVEPNVGEGLLSALQSPQPPPIESVLTALINEIAAVPHRFILVLDDYHLIAAQPIHDALAFLLDHLPGNMHLVIATRSDPPLHLARLRGRGQLTELRTTDLRFTPNEVVAFLNEVMGLGLSAEDVATLAARTEGWIAGLQMAALSMRGQAAERVADFIVAFGGSHRHVIDYLAEEVMAQQSGEIHDFLCQTSILDRLTAPLCDAVTGRDDSETVLRQLEQANLFLVPLDDRRKWYRYHRLFADFLRSHLRQDMPDLVRDLHCWAAEWYERNGLPTEAVRHTLKAADFEWAARLIEQTAQTILMRSEVTTLLHWLEMLPDALIRSRPRLCVIYAEALVIAGQLDAVEPYLQDAERNLRPDSPTTSSEDLLGQVTAIRAYLAFLWGDVPRAAELAQQVSERLSTDDSFLHSAVTWLLGATHYLDEDATAASRVFTESIELSQATGNILITLLSTNTFGYLQAAQGHLRQASELFHRGLQLAEADNKRPGAGQGRQPSPGISLMYQGLGDLSREWNNLQDAERYLTKCIKVGEQWGNAEVLADSYVALARVKQAQGNTSAAHNVMGKAEQLVRENKVSPLTARQIEAHRARLWVAQGNLEAAARWAALRERAPEAEIDGGGLISLFMREIKQCTLARLLIAQRRFDVAINLTTPLLQAVEAAGLMGFAIEILVLHALALQGQGKTAEALTALHRALSLAEPEGYVRVFADEGAPMAALLRQAAARGVAPDYISELLTAFGAEGRRSGGAREQESDLSPLRPRPPAPLLIEPLSERELEVLRLIAAGLSNREIAERLVVAISTVKTHINNIYRKLDVSRRTQAVARARELNLLAI